MSLLLYAGTRTLVAMRSHLGGLTLMLLTARLSIAQLPSELAVDARFTPSSVSASPLSSFAPGVLAQRADDGDDPCGDLRRGVEIGAAVGALAADGMLLRAKSIDGTLSRDPMPYLWAGLWGAVPGILFPTAVLMAPCNRWHRDHPQPRVTICTGPDGAPRSDGAIFANGALVGGIGGFMAGPIVAFPYALFHASDFNWDRTMALGALVGAAWIGPSEVARAHRLCPPSNGSG